MADSRAIAKIKRRKKARFEAKIGPGEKSLVFILKEINKLKRYLSVKLFKL
jgi:hypothetical protein